MDYLPQVTKTQTNTRSPGAFGKMIKITESEVGPRMWRRAAVGTAA